MHHFIYPTQDSFISSQSSLKDKNFGLDEMLSVGISQSYVNVLNTTKDYTYSNEFVSQLNFQDLTAILTGSFVGSILNSNGSIIGGINRFTSSYFSGSISGSLTGIETGSVLTNSNFTGSLRGFSGSISSYSINGVVSSSISAEQFYTFKGSISSSIGSSTGYVTGLETKSELNFSTVLRKFIDRTLIKFDVSTISQSISSGDISNPTFFIKLRSIEAKELPTSYKIYAFPISQSWDRGDGYWSDNGGSSNGVSWKFRNFYSGSSWYSSYTDDFLTSSVDYLNDFSRVTESFKRGGGTWYNIPCTQSFGYEASDINLNVTPIANAWLNNTIPNEGIILMFSGETDITSSSTQMYFFSRDTNTIYSPRLDVSWDDSSWITGSSSTGSVIISTINPRFHGSISSGSLISNVTASGSFFGSAYLTVDVNDMIGTGSIVNLTGLSETINKVDINGSILGTSYISSSSSDRYITASFTSGDFVGCTIFARYSGSMVTGWLSGSFNGSLFSDHDITGSLINSHTTIQTAYQSSPVSGNIMGNVVSSSFDGGIFTGISTDGLIRGAILTLPFTGSYSYVTSSYSYTSSVELTSSMLQPVNTTNPFVVIIQDLKREYSFGDIPRINVFGREHLPLKTFDKSPQQISYITHRFLPSSSYYSIKDDQTEEIIVEFDNHTNLSCDLQGNYFYLDTTSFVQERFYKILIRVNCDDGRSYTFDSSDVFKIRR